MHTSLTCALENKVAGTENFLQKMCLILSNRALIDLDLTVQSYKYKLCFK